MRERAAPHGRRARIAWLAGLILSAALAAQVRAEMRPLTLYQRAGRSPLVVVGEVLDGDDRFAEVVVKEVLKGDYADPKLRVVYRLDNFLRRSWEEKLEFETGEYVCLFLKRYDGTREDDRVPDKLKAPDIFAPAFGATGKFRIPEEGRAAYVEAIREFVRVTAILDPVEQDDAIITFLKSENPHILQAGLEQSLDRRIATQENAELLMGLARHPREPIKLNALQVLFQVAEDAVASGRPLQRQEDMVNELKGAVMGEGTDLYRVEALKVVTVLGGVAEKPFLKRISKEDRSQLVRYQASSALMTMGE